MKERNFLDNVPFLTFPDRHLKKEELSYAVVSGVLHGVGLYPDLFNRYPFISLVLNSVGLGIDFMVNDFMFIGYSKTSKK